MDLEDGLGKAILIIASGERSLNLKLGAQVGKGTSM